MGNTRRSFWFRVFAFVLLGAIINVAVAWTCARLGTLRLPMDSRDGASFKFGARRDQALPHIPARLFAGWPMFALTRNEWISGRLPEPCPYTPIWPGFAINTAFCAAVLWTLFAAPLAIRRRRRIKRGLCPKCAYPAGASDRCTECGETVRPVAPAQAGGSRQSSLDCH